jgi:hypothetical protein
VTEHEQLLRPVVNRIAQGLDGSRAALSRLDHLLDRIDPNSLDAEAFLDLMAAVGEVHHEFEAAARQMGKALGLNSARDRIRAYLLANIGEVVSTYQLNGVSGIQESPRRIRELRVEEGMQITAGPTAGLKGGEYRLEATESDKAAARRWRQRINVRRSTGSAKDRSLLWLRAIYPDVASQEDLVYVARTQDWPGRMRELEEDGWDVISSVDDSSMPIGSYRLGSPDSGPPRSRETIEQRMAILRRDGFACQGCGASHSSVSGTVLQVHHNHRVRSGRPNSADHDLVTLCANCHVGEHANDSYVTAADDLLNPEQDPWNG